MVSQHLRRTGGVVCVALVSVAMTGIVIHGGAQSARPRESSVSASLDDLLAELRALRADLNHGTGASVRTQLLVARLQLQEQRINTVAGQLAEIRRQLTAVQQGQVSMGLQVRQLEDIARSGATTLEAKAADTELPVARAQLEGQQHQEQGLRAQEAQLSSALANEQARWTDFSERLDALERSLTVGAPR